MPDGDKIHNGLRFFYQNAYMQLCEDAFEPESVAREWLRAMRKALKYDGGGRPLIMLDDAAVLLSQIPADPIARGLVDWGRESSALEQLARKITAKKRVSALLLQTCKDLLCDLREGKTLPKDAALDLNTRYFNNIYQADFANCVPLSKHYNDANPEVVEARLETILPYIKSGLADFATQRKRRGANARLRLMRRQAPKKTVSLHETDLAVF